MRNESRIFLIDIDGVACDHAQAICSWVNDNHGVNSSVEEITSWDHDFGPITFTRAVEVCYEIDSFIRNMRVTPGFSEFLNQIKMTMDVKFATARNCSYEATKSWIRNNFGDGFETHFVNKKADVDCDYIIDDHPDEIISSAAKGKVCFLFDQPWNSNSSVNRKLNKYNKIYRVESFADVFEFLS